MAAGMDGLFAAGRLPRLAPRRALPLLGMVSAFIFAAGCASADPPKTEAFNQAQAQRVLSEGYRYVSSRYIDDVPLRKVALESLRGVAKMEPALELKDSGGVIELLLKGQPVGRFANPEQDSPQAWAELVTHAIEATRAKSEPFAARSTEDVLQAVFDSTLSSLDPFSRYTGAREAEDNRASRDGFGGIGVTLRMETEDAVVQSVVAGGPAARAGVLADDRVTHVDGKPITGWAQIDVIRAIRGQVGDAVELKIARAGSLAPVTAKLQRERIVLPTVVAERRNDALILHVSSFNQETSQALAREINAARADTASRPFKGVVLDLRNNPGGLLDQAIQAADIFLEKGEIVATRGRHPSSSQHFAAGAQDLTNGLPLVVLVNGGSASASEVLAAALQDLGRAVVVGTNSYGKGTVQTVLRLPNNGEMTLTWSRLLAPSGYILHGLGVMPSVCTHGSGQVADTAAVIAELKSGNAGAAAILPAWRMNTAPNGAQVAELRQRCKSDNRSPEVDLAIADALFADAPLYTSALAQSAPSLAGR
ncbi:MAG: S41 family peptidase [Alphaproteobacteria bacterium]|nr:S41 family peptidase [Alphaproteobacteria bacterium]